MTEAIPRVCPACGEAAPGDANWCEACGGDLDAPPPRIDPCVSCGAAPSEITDDGWCQLCGQKQPAPEDHVVVDRGWYASVSDRGRTYRVNEDAGAIGERPDGVVLVVCDGVSSTDAAENAAQVAAHEAVEVLVQPGDDAIEDRLVEAAERAQAAVVGVTPRGIAEPPSCTFVAAVAQIRTHRARLTIGWLGDSRALWMSDDHTAWLTHDHSWSNEQLALGELSEAEIAGDGRAHSITRWIGADSIDVTPELAHLEVALPGTLLLCSDGLWNYVAAAEVLAALAAEGPAAETPYDLAERLVAYANEQGGHDNITVAVARLEPVASTTQTPEEHP